MFLGGRPVFKENSEFGWDDRRAGRNLFENAGVPDWFTGIDAEVDSNFEMGNELAGAPARRCSDEVEVPSGLAAERLIMQRRSRS